MTDRVEPPDGVEVRERGDDVVANHLTTGISAHGDSVAEALGWLAEALALELGYEGAIDDPVAFLAANADAGSPPDA
jgi:predicted RNase H-like HicB family nuclease